jgi:hypothetical protein
VLRDGFQTTSTFLYTRGNKAGYILSEILQKEIGMTENLVLRDIARMNRETSCDRTAKSEAPEYGALTIEMISGICILLIFGLVTSFIYFLFVETNCFKRCCTNDITNDRSINWGTDMTIMF